MNILILYIYIHYACVCLIQIVLHDLHMLAYVGRMINQGPWLTGVRAPATVILPVVSPKSGNPFVAICC